MCHREGYKDADCKNEILKMDKDNGVGSSAKKSQGREWKRRHEKNEQIEHLVSYQGGVEKENKTTERTFTCVSVKNCNVLLHNDSHQFVSIFLFFRELQRNVDDLRPASTFTDDLSYKIIAQLDKEVADSNCLSDLRSTFFSLPHLAPVRCACVYEQTWLSSRMIVTVYLTPN